MKLLPGGEKVPLSTAASDPNGVEKLLKLCAPLAVGEWRIFGQQIADELTFGVFRGSSNPISVSVDDTLLSEQTEATVIKLHQVAEECVQLRSSKGHCDHVFFNHRKVEDPTPLQYIDELINSIVKKVEDDVRDAAHGFIAKTIQSALVHSHGCLLAVTSMPRPPQVLSLDAVILDRPIDFPSLIRQLKKDDDTSTWLQHIEREAQLVEGMINCDGITLFDQYGKLLAYRCFIQLPRRVDVGGGARRRAFETLKGRLGKGLSAVSVRGSRPCQG